LLKAGTAQGVDQLERAIDPTCTKPPGSLEVFSGDSRDFVEVSFLQVS